MNGYNAPKEFQIYPWGKEINEEVKNTLGREKPGGGIEDTGYWKVDSIQEHQDSTEEPRNRHQGVLSHPHGST
jgi:hypothetical protein